MAGTLLGELEKGAGNSRTNSPRVGSPTFIRYGAGYNGRVISIRWEGGMMYEFQDSNMFRDAREVASGLIAVILTRGAIDSEERAVVECMQEDIDCLPIVPEGHHYELIVRVQVAEGRRTYSICIELSDSLFSLRVESDNAKGEDQETTTKVSYSVESSGVEAQKGDVHSIAELLEDYLSMGAEYEINDYSE